MSKQKIVEKYYEKSDFTKLIESSPKKKYISAKTKRVTMNISENAFEYGLSKCTKNSNNSGIK